MNNLVFNYVLNASVKKIVEEQKGPETTEKESAPKEIENPVEVTEGKYEEKRRAKKGQPIEVKKEELLERPENALTYEEYLAQLGQKNQALNANNQKTTSVERPPETLALNPQQRNEESLAIGVSSAGQKKHPNKNKIKEHKVDQTENELNKVFADALTLTNDEPQKRDYESRGPRVKKEETGPKFHFNAEEFPEL